MVLLHEKLRDPFVYYNRPNKPLCSKSEESVQSPWLIRSAGTAHLARTASSGKKGDRALTSIIDKSLTPEVAAWAKAQRERLREWEDSPDGIVDELRYYGDSPSTEIIIIRTLQALPSKIRKYALAKCVFLSIGNALGTVWPSYIINRRERPWLILLKDGGITDGEVAHEVAHAWLKHDRMDPETGPACEIEACRLARECGFDGLAANEKLYFKGRLRTDYKKGLARLASRDVHPK